MVKNQSKEHEFLNDVMSHDINNINQGVIGYLELLLKNDSMDETTKRYLNVIHDQVLRSSRIISDVKKINQIRESEKRIEDIDLLSIVNDTITKIKDEYSDRNVRIDINYDGDTCIVKADDYLEDLVFNLLSNAVLYNNDEVVEITIDLSRAEKGSEPGWKISIEDHCEGISDELKEIIFNKHERNLFGGKDTGLGLEIINAIINRYESHIWIENRVDSDYRLGNKFNFILPGGGDQ